MDFSANITGLSELINTFTKLPAKVQKRALKPALRKGGKVIRDKATEKVKSLVSAEATGLGENSLRVYNMKNKDGKLRVGVMVKKGLKTKKGVRVGLYMSVLEYGKKDQPPRSYLRSSARESTAKVLETVRSEAAKNMDAAVQEAKQ